MTLLWSIVVLLAANAVAIAALLFVRRHAPEGSYFADGDRASGVFGVLATGFAIFAGFVIFLAFTSYDQSRSGAEAEALTVAQQFETPKPRPSPSRSSSRRRSSFQRRSATGLPGNSCATGARSYTRSGRACKRGNRVTRSIPGQSLSSGA